jgi:hypothetical protein
MLILWIACAKIVSPTGGPKDITPPKLLKSSPANKSTKFNGNKIVLNFDEFVNLKDADKYLLVSPPLSKTPEIKVRGKSVQIKLDDTLKANTTYNLYLGNAIVDITEGNPLKNFNFAFSTGSVIDSLSITGKVYNALTQEPEKDVFVFLYTDFADSTPFKQKPTYVSRTNDFGRFRLPCLANRSYRMLALRDMNGDLLYNPKAEDIAFADSLVDPSYSPEPVTVPDTIKETKETRETKGTIDTKEAKTDTGPEPKVKLQLFKEPDSIQRLIKSNVSQPNLLTLSFRYPAPLAQVHLLKDGDTKHIVREYSKNFDTLSCWLLPPLPDSVKAVVSVNGVVLDTIIRPIPKPKEKSKKETRTLAFSLVSSTGQSGYLEDKSELIITSSIPLKSIDTAKAKIIALKSKDTLKTDISIVDSINRRFKISNKWKENEDYKVVLPGGMIIDMLGRPNDTTVFTFKLRPIQDYGKIILDISRGKTGYPVILQLLDEKGNLIRQRTISTEKKIIFDDLLAGKYKVKAIYDYNGNCKWDTGMLLKKRQPEKVALFPKIFEVRANWDIEESWQL